MLQLGQLDIDFRDRAAGLDDELEGDELVPGRAERDALVGTVPDRVAGAKIAARIVAVNVLAGLDDRSAGGADSQAVAEGPQPYRFRLSGCLLGRSRGRGLQQKERQRAQQGGSN